MMRLLAVMCWLVVGLGAAQAAAAPLYDSPEGGFAFEPPKGWEIKKEAAEAFPTLSGPKDDLRAPYVVIEAVHDKRDLFTFGDAAMKEKLKDEQFQLGRRDAFQTDDKQFAVKFTFTFSTKDPSTGSALVYKQAYYLVPGPPGIIYAFLATVPEAGWTRYEAALDDMMKSYHLRPVVAAKAAASVVPNQAKSMATATKP